MTYIPVTLEQYLKENRQEIIKKTKGWYSRFKDRYYRDTEKAKEDIIHAVEHQNRQFGRIFGETDPNEIIGLFDIIDSKKGFKIVPKVKIPKDKKPAPMYETDSDLVLKQKSRWTDVRGIELGRYLSALSHMDTMDDRIYGTEKTDPENVSDIMTIMKNGDPLPPILLDYDFGILDGHHRWEAAKKLKIKKIPVVIYRNPQEES